VLTSWGNVGEPRYWTINNVDFGIATLVLRADRNGAETDLAVFAQTTLLVGVLPGEQPGLL